MRGSPPTQLPVCSCVRPTGEQAPLLQLPAQVRVRVRVPDPQLFEQALHDPQLPQVAEPW